MKEYHQIRNLTANKKHKKTFEGGEGYVNRENEDAVEVKKEKTFEDIYDTLVDKQMDRELVEYINSTKYIEDKAQTLAKEVLTYPTYIEKMEKAKEKIKR